MKRISLLFLVGVMLLSAMLLSSCGDEACTHTDSDANLVCDSCGESLPDPNLDGKIIYEITVLDAFGNPCPNIIVELYDGEEKIATKMTNNLGVVKCSDEHPVTAGATPFTVKLVSPDGKTLNYDTAAAVISDGKEEITLSLFMTAQDLPTEHLYFNDGNDSVSAPIMSEGRYLVNLNAGRNYFVFYATARGQYKISADASATLGYFGAPFLVQSNNIASTDGTGEVFLNDGALFFNVRSYNVGDDFFSSSLYVFGVDVTEAVSTFIELKCVDPNLPLNSEELPWEECLLPVDPEPYTPSFTVGSAAELTPVSVTDPEFVAVYNPQDGFYHVGAADGPVILVKISVDSEFLASFKTIMETTQLRGYVYGEDGNLIAKKSYHGMMEKYVTAAGDLGVYPLTSYLKDALTTIGNAWGWYDEGVGSIFTGKLTAPLVRENAYLFACCYYEDNQ